MKPLPFDFKSMAEAIVANSQLQPNGCRFFMGTRTGKGYGEIRRRGKNYRAHRVIYEAKHGPLPKGILACHSCDNPPCVEEGHLFAGTPKDNTLDMTQKDRARGRLVLGHKLTHRRFSDEDIAEMRTEYAAGVTQVELAQRFGTWQGNVSNLINGRPGRRV
jgi:hypothetical protein